MRVLGFRAEADSVHWAVIEGFRETPILVAHDKSPAPKTYDEARSLAWFRERALLLITTYTPDLVVVRYPEPSAPPSRKDSIKRRFRVEGILLEASASRQIKVETPTLVTISAHLGSKAKEYLGRDDIRGLDWSGCPAHQREAILAAAGFLPEEAT
jgi:hypothetical protein